MASQAQVEANSLSSITQLAANPPKYPRNPTETKRPSLVLYIARVPGKRDVILTTLKPRLKNVTAEDVASSLYYFHLDTPEDERLKEELQRLQMEEEEQNNSSAPSVPSTPIIRKPVASSVRSIDPLSRSSSLRESQPESNHQEQNPTGSGNQTHAVNSSTTATNHWHPEISNVAQGTASGAPERMNSISRKPIPGVENKNPRSSMPPPSNYTNKSLEPSIQNNRLSALSMLDGPPPPLRHSILTGIPAPAEKSLKAFSLTIIRRDPGSGAQWNIGNIRSQPMLGLVSKNTSLTANPDSQYNDISVLLTTPGYNRFPKAELTAQIPDGITNVSQPQESWNVNTGFTRQVRMEWTRPKSPNKPQPMPPLRRQDTGESFVSTFRSRARSISDLAVLQAKNAPKSLDMSKSSKSRPKGYTFTSPWGGRCDFITGTDGRSLKCKHTLPSATSNVNPMASSNQISSVVSELRYNLPSSVAKSPVSPVSGHGEFARATASKLSHIRNKLSSESRSSSRTSQDGSSYAARFTSDDDDDDPYGLQLGQEKAGGGNRGKRAKLGKLIVHDEGLKMLDVIVAANIGVWWSSWGR